MANKKVLIHLSENNDAWGGWEDATDYDVKGKGGNDKLYGYKGNDTLSGDDGDDEIYGSLGNDKLLGGNGRDKLFGGEGHDEIDGGADDDEIFGGNGRDYIKGGKGRDKIFGGAGNDEIDGGDGNDNIYGEGGRNVLRGGAGQDLIFGGDESDVIAGGLGQDTLFGGEGDDFIQGNESADTLYGGGGDDSLEGNEGDDVLYGEGGDDSLAGNEGNDSIYGGAGNDIVLGNAGADALFGNEGADRLSGDDDNDSLYGGDDNDLLIGGAGDDALYGEAGDDILIGVSLDGPNVSELASPGMHTVDTLVGGTGQDTFVLGNGSTAFYDDGDASTAGSSDYAVIKDFNRFEDTILLSGSASDYVVATLPTSLDPISGQAAGLYLDSDGSGRWNETDELIAVIEQIAPESLVLESAYFQFADSPEQTTWHPTNDADWELVFSDEFDLTALDSQKWNTRYGHNIYEGRTNPWNAEQQAYVGDNEVINGVAYDAFDFNNGVLSIVAQEVEQPITLAVGDSSTGFDAVKTFDYTSGLITSQDNVAFTYGYMEIRAQVAAGQGLWPAFWMLPTAGGWPPEIDIMESLGQRTDTVFNSFHSTDEAGTTRLDKGEQTFNGIDFSADFHTYGVKWTAEALTWIVDGQALFTIDHNIPNVPMYLLANMAVGGYWPGSPDETTLETSEFKIDRIRVYQNEQGTLHGGSKDDVLTKALGHLSGEAGNDSLFGGAGDNVLSGGAGNDVLNASGGNDTLLGTDIVHSGVGEIDTLTGGTGADVFVLGEAGQRFYDDGILSTAGRQDYALIQDFEIAQDTIQLVGSAADYHLGVAADQVSTELWHRHSSAQSELIAVLAQTNIINFDRGFSFVA